ncbi:MAG: hypothetical protein JXA58_02270, partial [Dehalococcoidia bacterium]|nr:hypothetical protein [Dehalococcoidia bacterium]
MSPIAKIDFSDYSQVIPAFGVIILMNFTYNLGVGLCGGFVLYPLCRILAGKARGFNRRHGFFSASACSSSSSTHTHDAHTRGAPDGAPRTFFQEPLSSGALRRLFLLLLSFGNTVHALPG